MKIKYKNKHYCISPCAKDKFETYILEPVTAIIFVESIITVLYIALSILGFFVEGVLVTFFHERAGIETGIWFVFGLGLVVAILLTVGIILMIKDWFKRLYQYVQYRVSAEYTKRYKPECKLFIECKE
jgi:succinate dehydrogenase hydrophobic anchor subunit